MFRSPALLALAAVVSGLAPSAGASTLSLTGSTLEMRIGPFPSALIAQDAGLEPVLVSSGGGSFVEPAGLLSGTVILPKMLFTGFNLISSLNVTVANGSGSLTPSGGPAGGFGGSAPIVGRAVLGLSGFLNLSVPLSVAGAGGQANAAAFTLLVTVTGHAWTTAAAVVTGISRLTAQGGFVNTVTLSGYDDRSTAHAGTLQLVTPVRILNTAGARYSGFAVQTLVFAAEPGTLLLLGSVIGGLVLAGQRKRSG